MKASERNLATSVLLLCWLGLGNVVGASTTSRLKKGTVRTIKGIPNSKKVWLTPGRFRMGWKDGFLDEQPEHQVHISRGFWMMQTEVTQKQFKTLMGFNPSYFKGCGLDCPVEQVSWHQAALFANMLSTKQNLPRCFRCSKKGKNPLVCTPLSHRSYTKCKGWRLPTEAEWEYAARAGTTGQRYGKVLNRIAWWDNNTIVKYKGCFQHGGNCGGTHPVRQMVPNQWNLYDVLGNVWEWTYDWKKPYAPRLKQDPVGPSSGVRRVTRGGGWTHNAENVRSSYRGGNTPNVHLFYIGFRLVKSGL